MRAPSRKSKSHDHFFKFIPPGRMSQVSIPESFRKYSRNNTTSILRRGLQKWPVKISDKCVFEEGWENFVRENGVEDFDIVVFKHEGKMIFDIMVFDHTFCEKEYPANQVTRMEVEKSGPEAKSLQKNKIQIKGTSKVTQKELVAQEYPHFKFTATAYIMERSFVKVPGGFAISNGFDKRKCELIVMDEKQRFWTAKLYGYKDKYATIRGIRDLLAANGLKKGDEISLELVENGEKPLMSIHLVSKGKAAQEYPHFKFTATAYSIKNCFVTLPNGFARSNGFDKKKRELIVMDEKQRSWTTKVNGYMGNCVRIRGIQDMIIANGFKEGDEFLLELVENGDMPLMNIHCINRR